MYYKVKVYKIEKILKQSEPKEYEYPRKPLFIDNIIVEKINNDGEDLFKEIYTDIKIDVFDKIKHIDEHDCLKPTCVNNSRLIEEGIQLFTFSNEIVSENKPSAEDVSNYFEKFFNSEYKKAVDKANIMHDDNKVKKMVKTTKKRYKEIMGVK